MDDFALDLQLPTPPIFSPLGVTVFAFGAEAPMDTDMAASLHTMADMDDALIEESFKNFGFGDAATTPARGSSSARMAVDGIKIEPDDFSTDSTVSTAFFGALESMVPAGSSPLATSPTSSGTVDGLVPEQHVLERKPMIPPPMPAHGHSRRGAAARSHRRAPSWPLAIQAEPQGHRRAASDGTFGWLQHEAAEFDDEEEDDGCCTAGEDDTSPEPISVHTLQSPSELDACTSNSGDADYEAHARRSRKATGRSRSHFVCDFKGCKREGRPFSRKQDYQKHLRTHTNDKPYACRIESCHKAFSDPSVRTRHEQTHSARIYNCPYCHRSYKQLGSAQRHCAKSHASQDPPNFGE